jgi:putative two-component system response regulator
MMQHAAHVVAVDDKADILLILEDLLGVHFNMHTFGNGQQALDYLTRGGACDVVLLDIMMAGLDGFEVCRRLKADASTSDIPIIFLSGLRTAAEEEKGLALGAHDFIHKPFSPPVVLTRVRNAVHSHRASRLLKQRAEDLEQLVAARTQELVWQHEELVRRKQQVIAAQSATIGAFCALAEARDDETGNHIRRTQHYVKTLAEALRSHPRFGATLTTDAIALLFKSAPLHDVGKVAIPDAILLKPGKLTPQEFEVMKTHCERGYSAIVAAGAEFADPETGYLRYAAEIAYGHHERWNGGGYPQGLAGEAIPTSARLMAVADVYDALISKRVYKPAFSHDDAIAMIAAERGEHFDPEVVDALLRERNTFREIAGEFRDDHHAEAR